ncbi:hypothetical protein D779_1240 [Imhoffiella purpurea]|uniref:Uncharacterized protein n=1 Tax=Imhoffiella purpurea TaxID=1249627 RepID=W9V7E8_9GAMM|nr:hypothetical protein D779_1240 [Imhoffiella purpurea]
MRLGAHSHPVRFPARQCDDAVGRRATSRGLSSGLVVMDRPRGVRRSQGRDVSGVLAVSGAVACSSMRLIEVSVGVRRTPEERNQCSN